MVRNTVKTGHSWCSAVICGKRSAFEMQFSSLSNKAVVVIFRIFVNGDVVYSSNSRDWAARPIRIEYLDHVTWTDQSASRISWRLVLHVRVSRKVPGSERKVYCVDKWRHGLLCRDMTSEGHVTYPPNCSPDPRKCPHNRKWLPSLPEVTPQFTGSDSPDSRKCPRDRKSRKQPMRLLYCTMEEMAFIFVLDVVRLRLWYSFGVISNNACAWSNIH